jgi:hypothetical protein
MNVADEEAEQHDAGQIMDIDVVENEEEEEGGGDAGGELYDEGDIDYGLTSHGNPSLILRDEKVYHREGEPRFNTTDGLWTVRWECKSKYCKATVTSKRQFSDALPDFAIHVPAEENMHQCTVHARTVVHDKCLMAMKEAVGDPERAQTDVYSEVKEEFTQRYGEDVMVDFSSHASLKSAVSRAAVAARPPRPTLENLDNFLGLVPFSGSPTV